MPSPLLLRADANEQIGTGHVMRCIALGQAWQDAGGEVLFITCCENRALLQRLRDESMKVLELSEPSEFQSEIDRLKSETEWVVLDGYQFTLQDQRAVREAGCKLLLIDDCAHLPYYECDLLLNQNINATELEYSINPDAQQLRGTDYILLRREFQCVETAGKKEPADRINILVTMGGADPDNVSCRIINALAQVDLHNIQINVVVGPANPHRVSLEKAVQPVASNIQLIHSGNMPDLMSQSDLAMTAAGSTCWELLSMGVPFSTVILADNQEGVARFLSEKAGVHCFGWVNEKFESNVIKFVESVDPTPLGNTQPSCLIDGCGAQRVVKQLLEG